MDCPCFTQRHRRIALSPQLPSSVARIPLRGLLISFPSPVSGLQRIVHGFGQRALFHFTASVAYIWRFKTVGTCSSSKCSQYRLRYEVHTVCRQLPTDACNHLFHTFFSPARLSVFAGIMVVTRNWCPCSME